MGCLLTRVLRIGFLLLFNGVDSSLFKEILMVCGD